MNIVAAFHAYKFTHFDNSLKRGTNKNNQLSTGEKIRALLFGINNPRPKNKIIPVQVFETIKLKSNKDIECWYIKTNNAKGTVILFHGYCGNKSSLLEKGEIFLKAGYNAMFVDFMGSGGSEGYQTTIGFYEAEEVKSAFEYLKKKGETNIVLYGTSMGAVAIMKAQNDYKLNVNSIIIECPFGTMLETVEARFRTMNVPAFPMADLLVFWGGVENGFNAFNLRPVEYAKNITCPTLLMYGSLDEKVSKTEITGIYNNIPSKMKQLKIYPLCGHDNYLIKYRKEWIKDVSDFLTFSEKKN